MIAKVTTWILGIFCLKSEVLGREDEIVFSQEEEAFGRGRLLQLSQHKWANQNPPQVKSSSMGTTNHPHKVVMLPFKSSKNEQS